jgi:uncharacterized protein (DUF2336 family)
MVMNPRIRADVASPELEGLQALASARTPEARQALFEQMVALLLDPKAALGAAERRAMAALAGDLLRFAGHESRAHAAQRLAEAEDPPVELLAQLALDEIEIAGPILSGNKLSDEALAEIAQNGSEAHRCAIAGRANLAADVTARIAEKDEIASAQILAANHSAQLTEATLNRLATLSQKSETLANALVARKDLTPVVAHRMFWWLTGAARRHVIETHAIDIHDLEKALAEAGRNGVIKVPDHMAVKRLVDTISLQSKMPVSGLIEIMRQGSLERFVWALCERLSIEFATGKKIVLDPGGEALAMACKALRAEKSQFINLFLIVDYKRSQKARPVSDINRIAQIFDRVTYNRATASVALWDTIEKG